MAKRETDRPEVQRNQRMLQSEDEIIGLSGACIDEMFDNMAPHLSESNSCYLAQTRADTVLDGIWACTDSVSRTFCTMTGGALTA